ncbi:MAG: hypothetical protein LBJ11_05110 [Oscillospiraceae bacterium]|nr:hypothetical protein [Oscillospiraceae bacterium]
MSRRHLRWTAALALVLLCLLLSACAPKEPYLPAPEDCAYAAWDTAPPNDPEAKQNTYGNPPFAALAVDRSAVAVGEDLYSVLNETRRLEKHSPGQVSEVLFDKTAVGLISYYDRCLYFSDYALEGADGSFDCGKLYRLALDHPEKGAELIYESRIDRELFSSFQLTDGFLYLVGSRLFHTFGVQKLALDGKVLGTVLSQTDVENVQISGGTIYFLRRGQLYRSPLTGTQPEPLLEGRKLQRFCLDGGSLCFTEADRPGVVRGVFADGKITAEKRYFPERTADSFFVEGDRLYAAVRNSDNSNFYLTLLGTALGDASGESISYADDVMPAAYGTFQPFAAHGRIFYFSWASARGYYYQISLPGGERTLLAQWDFRAPETTGAATKPAE